MKANDIVLICRYTLTDLFADTYHMVELRAHNHLGFSRPSSIVVKTAQGESYFSYSEVLNYPSFHFETHRDRVSTRD